MATVTIQKCKGKRGISYAVRYRDPLSGKKKHYKSYRRYKEAHQSANDLRALLDSGKLPELRATKFSPLTFSEVATLLKAEWQVRLSKKDLAEKTLYEYSVRLNLLEKVFGDRMLCQVSTEEVQSHIDTITELQTNVTANRTLSVFKKVTAHGLKVKAIIDDCAVDVKFLSEKDHERNAFLLPDELDDLIKATQKIRAKYYLPAIIYLGAEHGAAKQEILHLKWADINFDYKGRGLIKLYRTKNKRKRTETLMPRTKKALLDWKSHLEYKRKRDNVKSIRSDHVFCRIDGTPIKNFNKAWWAALRIAGVKNFHFHDLRHTFCSNLILSGAGLKEAKDMIGHSDISMTDRYTHLYENHRIRVQDQLTKHYSNGDHANRKP